MTQKNIEGMIYYDVDRKSYHFDTFPKEYFDDGVWKGDRVHYIFVCDHTLTFDLPEGFDTITPQLNALIATSYNLHVGPKEGGEPMTPAKAAKLKRPDRVALAYMLREKGGSEVYSKEDADKAFIALVG